MNLICWNVRGLGGSRTFRGLANLVRSLSPSLVFVAETRLNEEEADRIRCRLGFAHGVAVSNNGRGGGLACWWSELWEIEVRSVSPNHIDLLIKGGEHSPTWRFTGFYGFPETQRREEGWQLLSNLHAELSLPWLIGGDFNEVMSAHEKVGGRPRATTLMDNFFQCQQNCRLFDLGYAGYPFTWRRVRHGEIDIEERLDRFLANREWITTFQQYSVKHGVSSVSDHSPISIKLTNSGSGYRGRNRFRFENAWTSDGQVDDVVKGFWKCLRAHYMTNCRTVGRSCKCGAERYSEILVKT